MVKDIRAAFLAYFAKNGHEITPSAPLVPDDATLLFTNAGMVPFKNIFTGQEPRPAPPRRVSAQTCIRAGGKHNDLDNVGYTARHHTFFEMLGNFSFGDYFKEQAIAFAWDFVTKELALPKNKLLVTVHESDDEAEALWSKHVDKSRIYRFGDKDNFWQMGDTGPCGPCSEIFVDQGEEHFRGKEDYMGGDGDRFLEIWNLVFMQYERSGDGKLTPLPSPSIDTGMGLERISAVLEGKLSNYDSSLFMPLITNIADLARQKYEYATGASFRVIADHLRSAVFLLSQGVNFDKEGRGYVLRRIVRRALRHGYLLGLREPFLCKLISSLTTLMSSAYPYLKEREAAVKELLYHEEQRFLSTIENGLGLFNEELGRMSGKVFSADVAFKLYDTYGFPLDLCQDMLREKGLSVDEEGFNTLMSEQKSRAKAAWKGSGDAALSGDFATLLQDFGKNEFLGYEELSSKARLLGSLDSDFRRSEVVENGSWLMFDKTVFYAQSGGQISDSGVILSANNTVAKITNCQKYLGLNLAQIELEPGFTLAVGEIYELKVLGKARREIAAHHSATHLLHHALREILGPSVAQAGSLVEEGKLRFDFTYPKAMTRAQIAAVEARVNELILQNDETITRVMDLEAAKKSGALALFGEKYDEQVRVVKIGESVELCGGTHTKSSAVMGSFYITKEQGISAGVRRIEAVASKAALAYMLGIRERLNEAIEHAKNPDLLQSFNKLRDEIKALKSRKSTSAGALQGEVHGGVALLVAASEADLKTAVDEFKNRHEKAAVLLLQASEKGFLLVAGSKNCSLDAGALIKTLCQGKGGGRADFATGSLGFAALSASSASSSDVLDIALHEAELLKAAKELILKALA